MSQQVVFLHAAVPAIQPLAEYCKTHAPELNIVNLLDDGIQRHFQAADDDAVFARLYEMLRTGIDDYGAQAALVTCSAASLAVMDRLSGAVSIPVIKIDVPMAHAAVQAARRVGILVSFAPTQPVTISILEEMARRQGREVTLIPRLVPDVLRLLNGGDKASHDHLMTEAAQALVAEGAEALVLAQVSMAHLGAPLETLLQIPVFESLSTSIAAVRSVPETTGSLW